MSSTQASPSSPPAKTEANCARVGVVIPNWNGADVLDDCLTSLRVQDHQSFEVLVVDNGSHDGSVDLIKTHFPEVRVHCCESNTGFTGACNLGASQLFEEGMEYVLLLNNDTVARKNLLSSMVAAMQSDPRTGAVSPYIVFHSFPDQLWYGGGEVDLRTGVTRHVSYRQRPAENVECVFETDWANGCAFLLTADAFRAVGLLSPEYFASYEDVDLSLRLRRAGFIVAVTTGTVLNHKVSMALGGKGQYYFYMARNRLILLQKHGIGYAWLRWTLRMFFGSLLYAIARLVQRDVAGFKRQVFEFLGVTAFLVGQRGKAPGWVYRYGSARINA